MDTVQVLYATDRAALQPDGTPGTVEWDSTPLLVLGTVTLGPGRNPGTANPSSVNEGAAGARCELAYADPGQGGACLRARLQQFVR